MPEITQLLESNRNYASSHHVNIQDAHPARRLAIVTCMDARIDVFAGLGLKLGDAHVIRNAGGRVTEDVMRSLTVSTNILGVDTVVLMQHTPCGMEDVTDEELSVRSGADLDFLPIDDHEATLRKDIDTLTAAPYLQPVTTIAGLLFDLRTGQATRMVNWERL